MLWIYLKMNERIISMKLHCTREGGGGWTHHVMQLGQKSVFNLKEKEERERERREQGGKGGGRAKDQIRRSQKM